MSALGIDPPNDHERRDVSVRPIVVAAVALALLCLAATWVAGRLTRGFEEARPGGTTHPLAPERQVPPEPRLQHDARTDLRAYVARQDELAGSYGWIDRDARVVRIPLQRALELVAEEGLPARAQAGTEGAGTEAAGGDGR